jgi:uncharacterized OsmC-like protein
MDHPSLTRTIDLWQREPERAQGKPTAVGRTQGTRATLQSGSFQWDTDLPEPLGGSGKAPSPTQLLLSALAGCAVVFLNDTLAPQLGVDLEAVAATARCRTDSRGLLGMAGVSPDLQEIELDIELTSSAPESALRGLLDAWQARCPIYRALVAPSAVALHWTTVVPEPQAVGRSAAP